MSQKRGALSAFIVLSLLLLCATLWADSDTAQIKCLPEQPSELTVPGDEVQSTVGVHRNQVLLEIGTGVW